MPPPNAPSTVRRKGHGHTLIDTHKLRNSIEARLEEETENEIAFDIGVFDPEVVDYAQWNHDGTLTIPARPFITQPVDEIEEEVMTELEQSIIKQIESIFD